MFRLGKYTKEKTRSFRNKAKATFLQDVLPVFQCDVYNVEINCLFVLILVFVQCFDSFVVSAMLSI